MKEQIRHCIAPQQHSCFEKGTREYWNLPAERWCPDAAANPAPLTTITYRAAQYGLRLKVYLKTIDQRKPVSEIFLRTELSLSGAAPKWAGFEHVKDITVFAAQLRKNCSKGFFIGQDFKGSAENHNKWQKYGATWDIGKIKGLKISPDAVANQHFGAALHELGRSLQHLKPAPPNIDIRKRAVHLGLSVTPPVTVKYKDWQSLGLD